jgi:hypothetical protein
MSSMSSLSSSPLPSPPKRTFVSERFIDSHMMTVRMSPDAPTRVPAMMRTVLFSTNPVVAAASPE